METTKRAYYIGRGWRDPDTYKKPSNMARASIFAPKHRTSILSPHMGSKREESWKAVFRVREEAGRRDTQSKRDCTSAINMWSTNVELHTSLLEFGVVQAIHSMIENNTDEEVLEHCVETAFKLSTNRSILHELNSQSLYTVAMTMLLQGEELSSLPCMVNCSSILLTCQETRIYQVNSYLTESL